jgi:mRNA interferase MazF
MRFGGSGSEQNGWRPGLVFQNNTGNRFSPNIIALPLTSSLKKASQPTHVLLPAEETGLPKDSMVLCENPERMSKEKLGRYLTTLPRSFMAKVAEASLLASSAISYLDLESLVSAWHQARLLNAAN